MPRPRILVNYTFDDHPSTSKKILNYCDPLVSAGGLPLIAPVFTDTSVLAEALDGIDGVLLIGGPDYHPDAYGGHPQPASQLMDRRRHDADLLLARATLARRLPVLGICAGHQLLVIARGGALVQDIASEWPNAIRHGPTPEQACEHDVTIQKGTRLHALVGVTSLTIRSYHHQAVKPGQGGGLVVSAHAPDGVIEAVEDPQHPFLIGVQWHPERHAETAASQALFQGLMQAAGKNA
ncbi:MAG: gamma-glutamyl-gamma-aminobutyrate hydrolase family protein [Planctomycetota bacterium]